MENKNISNKALAIVFLFALFLNSAYSVDVIDMRGDNNKKLTETKVEIIETKTDIVKQQPSEILLFNNLLDIFNKQDVVETIAPYYNDMVFTVDGYTFTVYFSDVGIDKIVDGSVNNTDLHMNVSAENVNYLVKNWYVTSTFDKIKYIIDLDGVPLGEVIKLSGIAMSKI